MEEVSMKEFLEKVKGGGVQRVDFYGVNGERCMATMVGGKEIRVGEGFPTEDSRGYSSPLWVSRVLGNYGVPFKFHYLDNVKYATINSPKPE
mmetsp:Transcript_4939/g.11990  ORF Transcript_4939/g.11990 Transcript_4939/m.11990 type:complete len:92 (+) Transcript_4939:2-277(+)